MNIVKKKLSELKHPKLNSRIHTPKQIEELVKSLTDFEQTKPILIDENNVILAGNGLYEALLAKGDKECYCNVIAGLSENQKKKLLLADNKTFELGINDSEAFQKIIEELNGDFDIPGFDDDLLETLTASIEESNDIIDSYGIFDDEDVEDIKSVQREEHLPVSVQKPSYEPVATDVREDEVQPVGRFVICPHCGEKICL